MEKRIKISSEGPEFSRIVAGVWKWGAWGHQLQAKEVLNLVSEAIDLGITTFDHADIYGGYTDEALFGKALALQPSLREKMELVTKCAIRMVSENRPDNRLKSYDTSAAYIKASVENSLKALHTDRLDLLLIHRPDPLMHPDIIRQAIEELQTSGKLLHFGVSNFTPSQFEMLDSNITLCTNQVEISAVHTDTLFDGTLDQCIEKKISPMAWSPLGSGKIFSSSDDPQTLRIQKTAKELAARYDLGIDQVLLAWLLKHPSNILPVLGTANNQRLAAALHALDVEMDRQDWFALLEASMGHEVP